MPALNYLEPLLGGLLIGAAASLLLLFNGRIFGISGIFAGCLPFQKTYESWKFSAILGLFCAGVFLMFFVPSALEFTGVSNLWRSAVSGILVGFGTQLGSGCTSGHGVCGISRFSPRSIVATIVFILAGMVMVAILRSNGMNP